MGQPSVTTNPLLAHTTLMVPPPTDSMHSINFVELDDHIHMLSWDESDLEPIVSDKIYEIGRVILGLGCPHHSDWSLRRHQCRRPLSSHQSSPITVFGLHLFWFQMLMRFRLRMLMLLRLHMSMMLTLQMCSMLSAGVEWYDSSPLQPPDPWRGRHPMRRSGRRMMIFWGSYRVLRLAFLSRAC